MGWKWGDKITITIDPVDETQATLNIVWGEKQTTETVDKHIAEKIAKTVDGYMM